MPSGQANSEYLADMFAKIEREPDAQKARALLEEMTATLKSRYFYGVEREFADARHMLDDSVLSKENAAK